MKKINSIRQKITDLDKRIISLLDVRFDLVKEIGLIKRKNNIPVEQKVREQEILDLVKKMPSSKENQQFITVIYKSILDNSRKSQVKKPD